MKKDPPKIVLSAISRPYIDSAGHVHISDVTILTQAGIDLIKKGDVITSSKKRAMTLDDILKA